MKFKDLDGLEYEFDNISGAIYQSYDYIKEPLPNSDRIIENQKKRRNIINSIMLGNSQKLNINNLTKQYYIDNGIKQLTFKLTDQCNMRCKYCTYSDYYPFTSMYGNQQLKISDALKGVDIYMDVIKKHNSVWTNVELKPTFTFYGGEPLLQFDVIKQIVEYIEIKYSKYEAAYLMTTNALLINDEISKFIKKHNFHISISLDGYRENHNRNRVTVAGKGTFEQIDKIIRKYLLDYKNWNIFMCYDFKTDFDRLINRDRFGLGEDYFYDHIAKITLVCDVNTNYYNQFNKIDYNKYVNKIKTIKKLFIDKISNGKDLNFLERIFFEYEFILIDDRNKYTPNNSFYEVPLGNCIPGDKLFLQTDGSFTLCEKVPNYEEFILGDINTGIDIEKVKKLINKINEDFLVKCRNCEISRLCSVCYAMLYKDNDGKFSIDKKICDNQKEILKKKLGIYTSLKRKNNSIFDYFYVDRYLNNN
ncbi:MAG: radical SAM protein [[Eubacterium] sulci]|nr:radical SAM protein [[Eubacterium] sulci]